MGHKLLVVHGGGPTPVINASLYGVIKQAQTKGTIDSVYGAVYGTKGFLEGDFIRLDRLSDKVMKQLLYTPGTAIGTSRTPLCKAEYQRMVEVVADNAFNQIIFNGGNGTMDTCGHLLEAAGDALQVVGIPKTIDNDLASIDHSPGYGSAARYMAGITGEIIQDVKGMPIHVSIIESMGRNTGWIAASSALGRDYGYEPDFIYCPERSFDKASFLEDMERTYKAKGGVVVVASEGLTGPDGHPITKPIFMTDRATYFGDVGTYLAELVIKELGYKARSEKPGIGGRSSSQWISKTDRDEAADLGRYAVDLLCEGESGVMVGLKRKGSIPYETDFFSVALKEVMMVEKTLPDSYINEKGNHVTQAFIDYAAPLIGQPLPEYAKLI